MTRHANRCIHAFQHDSGVEISTYSRPTVPVTSAARYPTRLRPPSAVIDIAKPEPILQQGMIRNLAAGQAGMTSNAFLVDGERAVLVDVGSGFDVVSAAREHIDTADAVVLTHTHPDHVGNLGAVTDAFGVDVWGYDPDHDGVDHAIGDSRTVQLGDHEYEALHTPGHKDDHICLYAPSNGVLFAGDLVFADGGFGRTDLSEGDRSTLVGSIKRVHERVEGNLREMHVGHGPSVTTNPLQDVELALQAARMGV